METDPTAAARPDPPVVPGVPRGRRLAGRLPEILLEATSVVFAILLAFAVDEWREARGHAQLAARARATILAELRGNRDELKGILAANDKIVHDLQEQITRLKTGNVDSLRTGMQLAQLSAAAFQAAQSTQALPLLDFDWLVLVGRTYELQRTYIAAQERALTVVGGSGGDIESGEQPLRVLQRVNAQLSTAQQLGQGVIRAYDEVLAR